MTEDASNPPAQIQRGYTPPRWNIVSIALPVGAFAIGLLLLSGNSGTGDFAGAMGSGVLLLILVGGSCVLGIVAAIAALVRGERFRWLSLLGLLGNGAIVLPLAGLFLRG